MSPTPLILSSALPAVAANGAARSCKSARNNQHEPKFWVCWSLHVWIGPAWKTSPSMCVAELAKEIMRSIAALMPVGDTP